jgi:hypothetical protein
MPEVAFEFYGKMDESLFDAAAAKHATFVEMKKGIAKPWKPVHNCIPHHCFSTAGEPTIMTPVVTDASMKASQEKPVDIVEIFSEQDKSAEKPAAAEKAPPKELAVYSD